MEKEINALLKLHCRMFTLEGLAAGYRKNAKALKLCLKVIKLETKELNKCKVISPYEISEFKHRYETFSEIVKRLIKASSETEKNKAVEDLHKLTEKTQEDISGLREQISPLAENARKLGVKLTKKLESGTQVLSDRISETVDEIKKVLKEQ